MSVFSPGGLRFKFLAGKVGRSVVYGLALLQDFFENIVVMLTAVAGAMTLIWFRQPVTRFDVIQRE